MFKRKAYDELKKWKEESKGKTAALLEGARRVGKSTIVEEFAKREYKSYILIDFGENNREIISLFDDISKLDFFFLRLQALFNTKLFVRESVIIFDEVQLCPKARQAIKYLVKDGRYDYIETGSLISIKKNVKDILIPSEERKIMVYPMDYEEFCLAVGYDYELLKSLYDMHQPVGELTHKMLMQQFRIYLLAGGMPQAVNDYLNKKTFIEIDETKRDIIELYKNDLKKIDKSGRTSKLYESIPAQLVSKKNRFAFGYAIGKKSVKDDERLFDLLESKIVNPCYNLLDISPTLNMLEDLRRFKLYVADTGLFVTMLFNNGNNEFSDIYKKLLFDYLPMNLGYLYENMVSQMLASYNIDLFYHTFSNDNKTNEYEVDFLIPYRGKVIALEVKSNNIKPHASLDYFAKKYSKHIHSRYIISTKDYSKDRDVINLPIYFLPLLLKELTQK